MGETGRKILDSMMADWNDDGIRLGWPIPSKASDGDLDQDTGVKDGANLPIWANLALLLAAKLGRSVDVDVRRALVRSTAQLS